MSKSRFYSITAPGHQERLVLAIHQISEKEQNLQEALGGIGKMQDGLETIQNALNQLTNLYHFFPSNNDENNNGEEQKNNNLGFKNS